MVNIKRSEIKELAKKCYGNDSEVNQLKVILAISTGMCARTSYTTVGDEKEIKYETLIGIHDKMLAHKPPHSSPYEHCAQCMSEEEREKKTLVTDKGIIKGVSRNFRGFKQYREILGI